jgi:hypothetical protein
MGPTAAVLLSIAFLFLSNKKGTHEKDMGEGGPLPEGLGGFYRLANH